MKPLHTRLIPNWPIILVSLIYLLLVFPLLTMQGIAAGADGRLYFYPATYAFKQALAQGTLPHWSTQLQAGFPLLADGQPSVLYPLNILFLLLLPTYTAYNLLLVIHGLLGLIFTYAWGCCLKISRPAAALMGILFVLATPLLDANVPMMETLSWTPLLFLLTEKSLQSRQIKTLWIIGPILGIQWIAGFPQMASYSLIACSVYFWGRLLTEPFKWKARVFWFFGWVGVVILGVFLAMPLLLPTYELSLFSIRANGISGAMAGEKSQFPLALTALLLPATKNFWQQAGLGIGLYMGMVPFLVAAGTFFRRNKPRWYFPIVAMGVVTAVLSFGRFSPLFPIVRDVPSLSSFRVPSRFLFLSLFGLITLFGWGWDQLFARDNSRSNQWQERLFKIAIILYVLVSLIGYPLLRLFKQQLISLASEITFRYLVNDTYHLQSQAYYLEKISALYQNILNSLWSWPYTIILLFILLSGWLLIRWGNRHPANVKAFRVALGILVLVDMVMFVGGIKQINPLSLVTEIPETAVVVQKEIGDRLCRLYAQTDAQLVQFQEESLNLLPSNYHMIWGIQGTGLYSPLGFHKYYQLTENIGGVNLAFGLKSTPNEAVTNNRALLNYLNVCVITSHETLTDFTLIRQVGDVNIYRNDQALPRAFAVDKVWELDDTEDIVTAVQENSHLLSEMAILPMDISETLTPGAAETAQISIETYESTNVAINVQTEGTILLQLTDTYYPGWKARIDDNPTEILPVNAQFRAVVVPPGNHNVTFTFVPRPFQLGSLISATAFFLLIIWAGWFFWQKRLARIRGEK